MASHQSQGPSKGSSHTIADDHSTILASEQKPSAQTPNWDLQGYGLKSDKPVAHEPFHDPTASEGMIAKAHHRDSVNGPTKVRVPECGLDSNYVFRPISVPDGYPKLDYKPIMLRSWCMLCVLAFYIIVLGLLIALIFFNNVSFNSRYGYFTIQILPPIIGTITTSLWRAITTTLSRISPYISSASDISSANDVKHSARRTILARYFPIADIVDMIRNGDGILTAAWILWVLSNTVLAFKAVLLETTDWDDYWEATVTIWALYALVGIYILLIVCLIALIYSLWTIQTGLLWDPVSIADHLVLFRHSNFLAEFQGTEAMSRDRLFERFRHGRFRLGYWSRGSQKICYGFGRIDHDLSGSVKKHAAVSNPLPIANAPNPAGPELEKALQPSREAGVGRVGTQATLTVQQVSKASYRFVYFNTERSVMLIWMSAALILFALLLAAAITDMTSGIDVSLPHGAASFLFQFLPSFVVGLYTWFWEDVDTFCRATQPFIGMREPNPAAENILLKYTCLPPGIVTYTALVNKHWKVARVSAISLLQRLLPIIVAGMVTVVDEDDFCTIYASFPLLVISLIYLGSYVFLIPFEVTGDGLKRHLPRSYCVIADLISWCYASSMLRYDALDAWRRDASGHVYEQWQMEAAIRLKHHSYQFGVYKSNTHPGMHCIGFDEETKAEPVDDKYLRRRRRRAGHDLEDKKTWEMWQLNGPEGSKERPMDATTVQFTAPHPEEEEPTG